MSVVIACTLIGAAHGALQCGNSVPQQLYNRAMNYMPTDFLARAAFDNMTQAVYTGASRGALFGVGFYVANAAAPWVAVAAAIVLLWAVFPKQIDNCIKSAQDAIDPPAQRHSRSWFPNPFRRS